MVFVNSFKVVVVSVVASTALAFMAPAYHARKPARQVPMTMAPSLVPPAFRQQMRVEDLDNVVNGLFGNNKKENSRRFSLRRFFQGFVQFATKNKRKRLAALVFAATVWCRGLAPYHDEVPVAHATAIEQVQTEAQVELEEGTTEGAEVELSEDVSVAGNEEPKRGVASRKLATTLTGTAVFVPSVGYFILREQKKESSADSVEETEILPNATIATTDDVQPSENQKKVLVQNVLDKAKKARLKVDADTYLKSLQKEKSVITSAISKLTKQIQSSGEAESQSAVASEGKENSGKLRAQ